MNKKTYLYRRDVQIKIKCRKNHLLMWILKHNKTEMWQRHREKLEKKKCWLAHTHSHTCAMTNCLHALLSINYSQWLLITHRTLAWNQRQFNQTIVRKWFKLIQWLVPTWKSRENLSRQNEYQVCMFTNHQLYRNDTFVWENQTKATINGQSIEIELIWKWIAHHSHWSK